MVNMHTKFQPSSSTGVRGVRGDKRTCDFTPDPYTKFLNFPLCFGRDNMLMLIRDQHPLRVPP